MSKVCHGCWIEKDDSLFGKDKKTKDGLQFYCKECRKAESKKHYGLHKEGILVYQKGYYEANKDKVSDYKKSYGKKNSEILKIKSREYYIDNKDIINEKNRKYNSEHREEVSSQKRGYLQTPNGRISHKRGVSKRLRGLGWRPINNHFKGCASHHLLYDVNGDEDLHIGIYIPLKMHLPQHGKNNPDNQKQINIVATEWLMINGINEEIRRLAANMYLKYIELDTPGWFREKYVKGSRISKLKSKENQLSIVNFN